MGRWHNDEIIKIPTLCFGRGRKRRLVEEGETVIWNGKECRIVGILPNRQRVLLIDLDDEEKENPHNRKEARAEDIGANWD